MASMKVSLSFVAVLLSVLAQHSDGFAAPVPVSSARGIAGSRAMGTKALSDRVEVRPKRMHDVWRHQATMAASQRRGATRMGKNELAQDEQPTSRFSRISKRVRKMVRKAIMGYLPEEEVSYKEARDQAAAAAAALRGETQVADPRLRGDAVMAQEAAAEFVSESMESEEDEMDIFSNDFVQLDIGDKSPMEAEDDMMASLRRRLEQGMAPEVGFEQAAGQPQLGQQQRASPDRPSRPASFDGDTAVAELPPPNARMQQPSPSGEGATKAKAAPKLASREDVERLNRMFGSMGGEPLR